MGERSEEIARGMAYANAKPALAAWRAAHPRATMREIEDAVDEQVAKLRAEFLAEVAQQSEAEMQARCEHCGIKLDKRGPRTRGLQANGGEPIVLERSYAVCPKCKLGVFPLDRELGLLPGSPLLPRAQEALVQLGSTMPFAAAKRFFETWFGIKLGTSTARRQTLAAGQALVDIETTAAELVLKEMPEPPAPGVDHQQLSVDGAMVPLRGGEWAEVKTLAVGRVTDEPKTVDLSYFSHLCDHKTFTRLATIETHRRATERAKRVTAVVDGADWLQEFVDVQCPDATRIIDWGHSSEYVAAAARALFADQDALVAWRQAQLRQLWEGDPGAVLTELCQRLSALPPGSEAAEAVCGSLLYLARRLEQLQYARFRAEGRPIGSGCVESANKLVVEVRLKGPGMHWQRENVDPMLALRNAYCSGQQWSPRWTLLDRYRCARAGELAATQHQSRHPTPAALPRRRRRGNWRDFSLHPRRQRGKSVNRTPPVDACTVHRYPSTQSFAERAELSRTVR